MSMLMKSAMFRLPGGTVTLQSRPWRHMSPMWLGLIPTRVCWNVGCGVSPFVVMATNGHHCAWGFCLVGCSRTFVPSQRNASFPGSPDAIHPNVLVVVCGPASTWIGFDQCLWSGWSFEYA